jgi:hypothetical protein
MLKFVSFPKVLYLFFGCIFVLAIIELLSCVVIYHFPYSVRQTADLFADEGYMVLVPDYYRY